MGNQKRQLFFHVKNPNLSLLLDFKVNFEDYLRCLNDLIKCIFSIYHGHYCQLHARMHLKQVKRKLELKPKSVIGIRCLIQKGMLEWRGNSLIKRVTLETISMFRK